MQKHISLLIPVENQVRELDPKLLLACVAARRGYPSVVGSRREIELRIAFFPRSIYLSKGLKSGNGRLFRILRKLGHQVAAWDEEALVHLPPEAYYSRRLSPSAMAHVSHLFAWGEDNAELWRRYPHLPSETPIHVTGNPRGDLLRPELRPFYEKDAETLGREYGAFVLVNTNFNHVNAFSPFHNLFQPVKNPGEEPDFGEAGRGMDRTYAEVLRDHKEAVFRDFQSLIPALDKAFPEHTIVVRPHPTEDHEIYYQIAEKCKRVKVTNEGNIVPWLMAARASIHNGCTTGVEAYVLGVPAITYRATVNEEIDNGFYRLPNLVSHQCFNLEELKETLREILAGRLGAAEGEPRKAVIERYLAARDGPMACERIMDVVEEMSEGRPELPKPPLADRLTGLYRATRRSVLKRYKSYLPDSLNKSEFQRHRYPGISLENVRKKISEFQEALGETGEVKVEQMADQFFRIGG